MIVIDAYGQRTDHGPARADFGYQEFARPNYRTSVKPICACGNWITHFALKEQRKKQGPKLCRTCLSKGRKI